MKSNLKWILVSTMLFIGYFVNAQNTRISDHNSIGWFNYFGTIKLNKKFSVHTEYQWRREAVVKNWQQGLLRIGLNYRLNPNIQLRAGYGWIETFAYGEIPLNGFGKDFTEHRLFEAVTLNDKIAAVELSHRFMLEQRWLGRYSNANLEKEDEFVFVNRLRYMFRFQFPLHRKSIENKTVYLALYDEIFAGFGKNVNENVFDQNRLGVLLGYKINKAFRIEAGYLNQVVQLGREVNNRNVFQYNNGFVLNAVFNLNEK